MPERVRSTSAPVQPRRGRTLVVLVLVLVTVSVFAGVLLASRPARTATPSATGKTADAAANVARGRQLFTESCASCHGDLAAGTTRGPSLVNIGPAAVDFALSTGRMPLSDPEIESTRAKPAFSRPDINALIAFVSSRGGGGPQIPNVNPDRGDVREGFKLFTENCSGCHQIAAKGGIGPGFRAPDLGQATPTQVGEAMRVGPYEMPRFSTTQLSDQDVNSIARFVTVTARQPENRGGWGIGRIGPITEGLVALVLGGGLILIISRAIGEGRP